MELHVLSLGECCCDYSVVAPGVDDGRRVHLPVNAFLVRLPDERLVLVDTGMSRLHVEDPGITWRGTPDEKVLVPAMRPEDSLLFRLAQLGVAPQDIDYVVNTHLHFDHAGNNDLIGGAKFLVQRDHYEAAKGNPGFPGRYWDLPSLSYELLDGDTRLWDGFEVVSTPGHCVGHQSVVLRLAETGTVVLCGDAVYCRDNLERDAWDGQADPLLARESAARLQAIAEAEAALVVFGHDPEQARTLRKAPAGCYH